MDQLTSPAEAEKAIAHVADLITKLRGIVEQETVLVHAGKVRKATTLTPIKNELAGELFAACEQIKANAKFLLRAAPASAAALGKLQEAFRTVLQKNMVVLATSHSVSEGIVRRLSRELAKKASPQVYGASGRAVPPNPARGQPLAISRVL